MGEEGREWEKWDESRGREMRVGEERREWGGKEK